MNTTSMLPALFVSHGSPMLAIEPGSTGPALTAWGQRLQAQGARAVVIMSPHWMSDVPTVMTHPAPQTWHDFGGFPDALYRLQYPAPGSPVLAEAVRHRLSTAGWTAKTDERRPFDHGAWVPLSFLFPQADVPVVQLSLPASASSAEVYDLGQALGDLRQQGVVLIGSGSMTHNLGEFFGGRPAHGASPAPYVVAFSQWVENALREGDRARLFDYRRYAPDAVRAHPTDEHFLPMFFALGAAGWGQADGPLPEYISREVTYRFLSMDAFALA